MLPAPEMRTPLTLEESGASQAGSSLLEMQHGGTMGYTLYI